MSAARKEMQKVTNSLTVPVLQVGNRVLVGFSALEYEDTFKGCATSATEKE